MPSSTFASATLYQSIDVLQVLRQYILDNTPSKYHDYLIPTHRESTARSRRAILDAPLAPGCKRTGELSQPRVDHHTYIPPFGSG